MRSLPLFHRIAGTPVIVLGEGAMATPKRLLVERAGGVIVSSLEEGIAQGAKLAFVAYDDAAQCEADAAVLKAAGISVNVVDQPALCDFTTPSILDRDPVLIAIGTSGASAGLAKQLRLRLEALLPANLGRLAQSLFDGRKALKARFPSAAERRQALDAALTAGGVLDPLEEGSAERVEAWLAGARAVDAQKWHSFTLVSDDPDDLTLRQARLLGCADAVLYDPEVAAEIVNRARADAVKRPISHVENGRDLGLNGIVVRLYRKV